MNRNETEFNVGDVVIKQYGSKPFRITELYSWKVAGRFLHNDKMVYADRNSIRLYEAVEGGYITPDKTLYSFNDGGSVAFGTHVGTNSQNLFILEVQGRDGYVVKDPKELEEVLPYTFSIKLNGREVHYVGEPDKVSVGDWLILDNNSSYSIVQVQSINTKNKKAKAKFKGRRLMTERVC